MSNDPALDSPSSTSALRPLVFISSYNDEDKCIGTTTDRGKELEEHEEDIYRGVSPEQVVQPRSPSIRAGSVRSLSSSRPSPSSSSSSSSVGWRRGPIAQAIEQALARWARRNNTTSSTTSTESTDSDRTRRTYRSWRSRRQQQQSSQVHSGWAIRDLRPQECIPRGLVLLLPLALSPVSQPPNQTSAAALEQAQQQRVLCSLNLELVLAQLEAAFKRRSKLKRTEKRAQITLRHPLSNITDLGAIPEGSGVSTSSGPSPAQAPPLPTNVKTLPGLGQAWWLDVSSPLWEDMQKIGKLLHLHPLTLEDIFYQESREKMELFSALGYYFIVFRSLASPHLAKQCGTPPLKQTCSEKQLPISDNTAQGMQGEDDNHAAYIQAVNVYLVVFRDGIISFHFGDISNHLQRVRERIFLLENTVGAQLSSDWVAHGLMDSIVDSFFPVLGLIDDEVKALDGLGHGLDDPGESNLFNARISVEKEFSTTKSEGNPGKYEVAISPLESPPEAIALTTWRSTSLLNKFIVRWIKPFSFSKAKFFDRCHHHTGLGVATAKSVNAASTLFRITSTRRLVMGLSRLLAAKSEVVTQIQKRLMSPNRKGGRRPLTYDNEISIYIGDVYDHILSLQQSLDHYERILSHSHPAYLNFLQVKLGGARAEADNALVALTVVTVGIVLCQVVTGCFSMNIQVPSNGPPPAMTGSNVIFGLVIMGCCVAVLLYARLIRYWWVKDMDMKKVAKIKE